jgi:prolyl-tRNA synthetase
MPHSRLFGKTLRETPRNAGPLGLQLLLRAGFLKAAGQGAFLLLPLANRVLQHMDTIVETEAAARRLL